MVGENVSERKNARRRTQFEVFKGAVGAEGRFEKERLVGIAFLREGKLEYKLKVFPQPNSRFYVMLDESHEASGQSRYKVMVRDEVASKSGKTQIYWNEVGEGRVLSHLGLMEIKVDLWSEPLYMNIFPREFEQAAKPFAKIRDLKLVA